MIYLAFGSHTDIGEFYGWVLAYDAATLARRATYNVAPDWGEGGIWQSGCGLAGDADGYVYAVVGNGEKPSNYAADRPALLPEFTKPDGVRAPVYGNCIHELKLAEVSGQPDGAPRTEELKHVDWYTAPDVLDLNEIDEDLMSGPDLFEAPGVDAGAPRKLVLGSGKDGRFYLLDRDNLGRWAPSDRRHAVELGGAAGLALGLEAAVGPLGRADPPVQRDPG